MKYGDIAKERRTLPRNNDKRTRTDDLRYTLRRIRQRLRNSLETIQPAEAMQMSEMIKHSLAEFEKAEGLPVISESVVE